MLACLQSLVETGDKTLAVNSHDLAWDHLACPQTLHVLVFSPTLVGKTIFITPNDKKKLHVRNYGLFVQWTRHENQRDILQRITDTMALRGLGAKGIWIDGPAGLGHRRLSVIDLEGGLQPMVVKCGSEGKVVAITYSGEVHNFQNLRAELQLLGHHFDTHSDTEVVLGAFVQWGENFVEKLNGMYAFAIWDLRTQELLLVRDRLGVKLLYYFQTQDGVVFGSEPKELLANPLVPC